MTRSEGARSLDSALATRLLDRGRALAGTTEDVKWGSNLVLSVGGKMFAVFDLPAGEPMSLKVTPGAFDALSARPGIRPAPYLAKHSWIQLATCDALPRGVLEELLEGAHALVAAKLPKRLRAELGLA